MSYVLTLFIVEIALLLLGAVGFVFAINIARRYDKNLATTEQFNLAKNGYLVSTIIAFMLVVKLPLFLYFIWTMDMMSSFVPGAMCSAGIVSATNYGVPMFFLKIIILFLLCGWLLIHYEDSKTLDSKFLRLKFRLFIPLFLLLILEFVLEFMHFKGISLDRPVDCCSNLFSNVITQESKFWQSDKFIVTLFYTLFIGVILSAWFKKDLFLSIFSPLFMVLTWQALIRFFSTYVYELPTHKCPYCLLQADYGYIGYLIYILIFLGTLPGFFILILKMLGSEQKAFFYKLSISSNLALCIILSSYPVSYYIKNGVFL
ncbi:MAG: hypothetical protein GXZ15_02955 [Campylobacter sp.]|nr:hypothetical protein [Campylobacter sp.]